MSAATNEEFITASNFKVEIDGHQWGIFETVNGLGIEFEDIAYSEGKNETWNRPGRSRARDITLTRRYKKDPELYKWLKDVQSGGQTRKSGSVILMADDGKEVVRYNFFHAWPKSWSAPALSKVSTGNDTAIETIVLSVQDIELG